MFHFTRRIIRDNVLLVLVLLGSAFLGSAGPTAAQVPPPAAATLTGTAYRLVDQTMADGVVVDETEVPITDGRIAIPELAIDMPLAADGTFNLSNLPVSADLDNPTEVTVVFTAPELGSFTYLHLRIGQGYRPILTPQLIDTPRVTDVTHPHTHDASPALPVSLSLAEVPVDQPAHDPDRPTAASGQVCEPSSEVLVFPQTIRVWENGPGQDGLVHSVDFKFYVKHVLPREWIAGWDDESLLAGGMAVKSYAWWHATHAHKHIPGPECYDVDAGTSHQVFNPFLEDENTNAAVDATWDFYMIEGSELQADVVQAFHKQGLGDECGQWWGSGPPPPGDDMSQYGSHACADDGMPWYQILTTYYFPPPVSWVLLRASHDTDGDGCTNGREFGDNEVAGGRRNPLNFWDFFDTPDPNATPQRNGVININDIFLVAARFGTTGDPNGDPLTTPPKTGYHTAYDRTFLGPNPWDLGPPNGAITINELFWVAAQFSHSCI